MIVLIAPVIFFFLVFSKMKREKKLDLFKKFLVSAVVFMAIVGPYIYLSFKLGLIGLLDRAFLAGTAEGEPQANSIEGWLYYSKMLPLQMSVPFVIASVLTFIYHVAKKEKNFAELGMWFLVVYIAFTLTNNKSVRYTILYLPALIYVFVYTISKFDKKVFFAILVLTLLSEAYFAFAWLPRFNYPVAEVMEYVLGNSEGNIAIVSERGDLFSSAFIFQAAKIDVDRNTQIFRPCIFLGKNSSEIEDYMIRRNIEKLILVEDAKGAENIEKIRDITLEREFGEVSVFDYEKFVKIDTVKCNYICTLEEEICV
jgi:hypothetical protein